MLWKRGARRGWGDQTAPLGPTLEERRLCCLPRLKKREKEKRRKPGFPFLKGSAERRGVWVLRGSSAPQHPSPPRVKRPQVAAWEI